MGLMFNKIIPMEMLAQMPLPFVHRLRDLRIKQLQEAQNKQNTNPNVGNGPITHSDLAMSKQVIEDLVDELS